MHKAQHVECALLLLHRCCTLNLKEQWSPFLSMCVRSVVTAVKSEYEMQQTHSISWCSGDDVARTFSILVSFSLRLALIIYLQITGNPTKCSCERIPVHTIHSSLHGAHGAQHRKTHCWCRVRRRIAMNRHFVFANTLPNPHSHNFTYTVHTHTHTHV